MRIRPCDPIVLLVFLYFLTLSADQLHLQLFFFKPKLNHCIALFLGAYLFFSGNLRIIDKKLFLCFSFLVISLLCSAIGSPFFLRSLGYGGVAVFTFCAYLLIPMNLMMLLGKERVLRIYFASFLAVGTHALLQVLLSLGGIYDPFLLQAPIFGSLARGQSWTYEPSFYALYAIPFVFFVNTRYLLKQVGGFFALICNGLLLASISTSAFFAYGVFVISVLLFCCYSPCVFKPLIRFMMYGVCGFAGLTFVCRDLFMRTYYKMFLAGFSQTDSFVARFQGIVSAWEVFLEHPFLGVGLGGVGPLLYLREYQGEAPIELHHTTLELIEIFDPTNVFTEVLASLGLFGCVVCVTMVVVMVRTWICAMRSVSDEEKGILFAWLISSCVMLICLQINQGLFRSYVWVHLGLGLGYVYAKKSPNPDFRTFDPDLK